MKDALDARIEQQIANADRRLFGTDQYDALMETWSDVARAAAAAARRTKAGGGNWRKSARAEFAKRGKKMAAGRENWRDAPLAKMSGDHYRISQRTRRASHPAARRSAYLADMDRRAARFK